MARTSTHLHRLAPCVAAGAILLCLGAGAVACQTPEPVHLKSRPRAATENTASGLSRIAIANGRETLLYVPSGYRPDRPAPLLVLLHGATQSAELWSRSDEFFRLADELGIVLLMPNSMSTS